MAVTRAAANRRAWLLVAGGFAVAAVSMRPAQACEPVPLANKAAMTEWVAKTLVAAGGGLVLIAEMRGATLVRVAGEAAAGAGAVVDLAALVSSYFAPDQTVTSCTNGAGQPLVIGPNAALDTALAAPLPKRPGAAPTITDFAARLAHFNSVAGLTAPAGSGAPRFSARLSDPANTLSPAATTLTGRMRDARTQSSLVRATIKLTGPLISQETYTAADGSFYLAGLTPGAYTVSTQHIGYLANDDTLVVPGGQAAMTLDVSLTANYPCDFSIANGTSDRVVLLFHDPDGVHLGAVLDPGASEVLRGLTRARVVSAESRSPPARWPRYTIECGGDDWLRFDPK